ncbi:MAG: anthranilate synthase component I [Phycisphaerales bacterium]|nr:anthranilate synthase component I [Phycisphaerales bacterium]
MKTRDRTSFRRLAEQSGVVVQVRRLMSDQLTPVLAYRRLVSADERNAPSFLLESVEGGQTVGRHSMVGAQPALEVTATGSSVTVVDHRRGTSETRDDEDPLTTLRRLSESWRSIAADVEGFSLPGVTEPGFSGGWVGYAGYDAVRYLEPDKLPFRVAPVDDRGLPDLHFGQYRQLAVFDHVGKVLYAINHVRLDEHASVDAAYDAGQDELDAFVTRLEADGPRLPAGVVEIDLGKRSAGHLASNFPRPAFEAAVARAKELIAAGDIFQVVLSQRFRRRTAADPFEIYRALRIVNPSPYMIYLQAAGSILVASSPEILCRCQGRRVTSRPLAGTRRRGVTPAEDTNLEGELRADEKERAEHVMLVDLGRNDLGRVCELASIALPRVLEVERYSHVMHLSSTVTGDLRDGLDSWDALRATLPVGTVSGAPKVRAMQIIDELEPTRRGPYGGGIGCVGWGGDMDMAIALRTMVIPTGDATAAGWSVDLQAGAGIVADSVPAREYEETVSKAAGLDRAIDLAESAFLSRSNGPRPGPSSP